MNKNFSNIDQNIIFKENSFIPKNQESKLHDNCAIAKQRQQRVANISKITQIIMIIIAVAFVYLCNENANVLENRGLLFIYIFAILYPDVYISGKLLMFVFLQRLCA